MDLVCTDELFIDQFILEDADYEVSSGDENLMTITRNLSDKKLAPRSLVYVDGSDAGGIIDGVTIDTSKSSGQVIYSGRSWSGILAGKVICPDTGADHLTVSGDADTVIASIIKRIGLTGLFTATGSVSGITVNNYQFARYCTAWDGLSAMMASVGGKLCMGYDSAIKKVVLYAKKAQEVPFDSDTQPDIEVSQSFTKTNHLICLGKGEGAARIRCDWFADSKGNVSEKQSIFGAYEIAQTYEETASEYDKLKESGKKKLVALQSTEAAKVEVNNSGEYDVGDTITAFEANYGIEVKASITQKRLTEKESTSVWSYEAGVITQTGASSL